MKPPCIWDKYTALTPTHVWVHLNGMLAQKIIKLLTKVYQDICLDIGKDVKLDGWLRNKGVYCCLEGK